MNIEWETLNDEVMSLFRQGDYDHAVVVAGKALQVAEQASGSNHPDVATSLNNLAELYRVQGRYAQAEPLYKRALAIREEVLGPNHPDVATSLNNLALLYKTLGQYAQAEPLYKHSLAINEKALVPNPPDVAKNQPKAQGGTGIIVAGYICGVLSLFLFPPALGLAGTVCGIVNLVQGRTGHGIAQIIISVTCGIFGFLLGAAMMSR